jgi:hypothetical protein
MTPLAGTCAADRHASGDWPFETGENCISDHALTPVIVAVSSQV